MPAGLLMRVFAIIIGEIAHIAGLLPIAAVAWASMRRRSQSPEVRILAAAFAVSFVVDMAAAALAADGIPNLWLTYILAPIQMGLVLLVIAPASYGRVVWAGYGLIVASSLLRDTFSNVETLVQVAGGAWVCLVVFRQIDMERYRTGILLYFGATIPALLAMGFWPPTLDGPWMGAWLGYQAVRVTALAVVAHAVLSQPRMRLEIVHERDRSDPAGSGVSAGVRGHVPARSGHRFGSPRTAENPSSG